ncbi:MAG: hypothetical protein V3T86_10750 [Planctomycetota bacterium]
MRFHWLLAFLVCGLIFPFATADERRIYKPYVVLSGSDSGIREIEHHRITDQGSLDKLWRRHAGKRDNAAVPLIDFKRCMVVAVFGGPRKDCAGIVPSLVADGLSGQLNVTYAARPVAPGGAAVDTIPFGFFVIERLTKPITLKELAEGKRTVRAKLPALKG